MITYRYTVLESQALKALRLFVKELGSPDPKDVELPDLYAEFGDYTLTSKLEDDSGFLKMNVYYHGGQEPDELKKHNKFLTRTSVYLSSEPDNLDPFAKGIHDE